MHWKPFSAAVHDISKIWRWAPVTPPSFSMSSSRRIGTFECYKRSKTSIKVGRDQGRSEKFVLGSYKISAITILTPLLRYSIKFTWLDFFFWGGGYRTTPIYARRYAPGRNFCRCISRLIIWKQADYILRITCHERRARMPIAHLMQGVDFSTSRWQQR